MSASIARNIQDVLEKIKVAHSTVCSTQPILPRLVAVSKTKPIEDIIQAYDAGHRIFGENYIQELVEKSKNEKVLKNCNEIKWHFIGRVQTKQIRKLTDVPNLSVIETLSSIKMANEINRCFSNLSPSRNIDVMVQVNTSGEEQKGGITPSETCSLIEHVKNECPLLNIIGLMTIGAFDRDPNTGPNPDFLELIKCRKAVSEYFGIPESTLELSMGMSTDFEEAIRMGSTNVRVGSSIFGSRNYGKPHEGDGKPA